MDNPFNIVVLASGNGTNLGAILDAKHEGKLSNVQLLGTISNHKASGALEKTRDYRHENAQGQDALPLDIFIGAKGKTAKEYDQRILEAIHEMEESADQKVDLICLTGYMRILTPVLLDAFKGRIINVHPSLLPKYGGKGMYGHHVHEAVLAAEETETGMTIHYVNGEVDAGEIILQKSVSVEEGDTIETLKHKVQALEKIGYVEVLEKLSQEQ